MDKKTKMYVGAAVLVVAGYMVYKKMQDKKKAQASAPKQFAGISTVLLGSLLNVEHPTVINPRLHARI